MGVCISSPEFLVIENEVFLGLEAILKNDITLGLTMIDSWMSKNISPSDTKKLNSLKTTAVINTIGVATGKDTLQNK